ncbi:glutathione S-transferase family protein [Ponticaulis profundi]|uniref:Glutathione S-transferase family protein n=1 Tax=Ponticaulis profundi TaxID=2665222 RepID=A0ABW1SAA3_9PROT
MATAQTILLHQYDTSPFSEKVRLALRLKNLAWGKVDIPVIMPKPDLMPLTGGYRRTPVMQIGADVFCDSALILREIERRFPNPSLTNGGHEGVHAMMGTWADRQWFNASVAVIFGEIGDNVPEDFKKDRTELSGRPFDTEALKAAAPMMRDQWRAHLSWVEERLEAGRSTGNGQWLIGSKPGLADVHAHMNIWFAMSAIPDFAKECLRETPRTQDWFDRLSDIKGQRADVIESSAALELAKHAAPRLLAASVGTEPQGLLPGDLVAVAPDDYGQNWVEGELVSAGPNRITLQKVKNALDNLHIHFPRAGFLVRKL